MTDRTGTRGGTVRSVPERPVDELVRLLGPPPEVECEECHGDGDIIVTCHCCGGKGTIPEERS